MLGRLMNGRRTADEAYIAREIGKGRKEFRRLDARGLDLSGLDLSNITFEDCDFRCTGFLWADLAEVRFRKCDLRAADFSEARLYFVVFDGCNVEGADFRNSETVPDLLVHQCEGAGKTVQDHTRRFRTYFKPEIRRGELIQMLDRREGGEPAQYPMTHDHAEIQDMEGQTAADLVLSSLGTLWGADDDMPVAKIGRNGEVILKAGGDGNGPGVPDLIPPDWAWTDERRAWLVDELAGGRTDFQYYHFSGLDLRGIDMSGLDLTGADLSFVKMQAVCFRGSNLTRASFASADAERADLQQTCMEGTVLDGANFGACDCRGAFMAGVSARRALLPHINARHALIADTDFAAPPHPNLKGASFDGALVLRSRVTVEQSEAADFSGAEVRESERVEPETAGPSM